MTSFTCITCRVIFVDAELQRTHYKTEWHRYNLKRKVAQLPAVTQEDYVLRAEAQKQKVHHLYGFIGSKTRKVHICIVCLQSIVVQ